MKSEAAEDNQDMDLSYVGKYNTKFNEILGLNIKEVEIYVSEGLTLHMKKRKHYKCLKYIDCMDEIIAKLDYIGVNPNEEGCSIELIKKYADNVMIGIKLDNERNYLYVSTMHDVQDSKIARRLHSGRLKVFD